MEVASNRCSPSIRNAVLVPDFRFPNDLVGLHEVDEICAIFPDVMAAPQYQLVGELTTAGALLTVGIQKLLGSGGHGRLQG